MDTKLRGIMWIDFWKKKLPWQSGISPRGENKKLSQFFFYVIMFNQSKNSEDVHVFFFPSL